ncbi:MAG TPA: hypothetical protein VHZ28_10545 [Terracidiphilus sp.]|nr:hypothetical protein [Terracidiphilus sp.]
MGAFEETKCRRSIVSDTYECLRDQARRWREKVDLLEAGQPVGHDEAIGELTQLLDTCQNLRDAILSEESGANWKTVTELHALVERLDDVAAKRKRYLDLAQLLVAGTVEHRRERTKQERLKQRDAAVAELMEVSAMPNLEELPGPVVEEWLNWACNLEDGSDDPGLAKLKSTLPRVDEFVSQLEIEMWKDGDVSIAEHIVGTLPEGKSETDAPAASAVVEDATEVQETPAPEAAASVEASGAEEKQESPKAVATEEVAPPAKVASTRKGFGKKGQKPCFFEDAAIDSLKAKLEEGKGDSKASREVRALLGVSQWLMPADQNPVLHETCGIRALIGYKGSSDLIPVSPEDAERVIHAENSLQLFTGGADLLRWSISQRADGNDDAVASIQRLSIEQIRSWFADVYKIELAEPQVLDMYRLTSGIPLLVGELHRLVLPNPKTPPTWLGYAVWTNVKASFERRLPVLARELRNGSPAVRLTEQEIRVLKMAVIASDDSNAENLLTHLTNDWDKYHRPEIQAMNAKDEPRVELLQSLGLLPSGTGSGWGALKKLVPIGADDALRTIVSYL